MSCPGTKSEQAGKGEKCASCPNKKNCLDGVSDPDIDMIRENIQHVRTKILVMSGKGGVGKTTFSYALGAYYASRGKKTCILDLDITCPSLAIITNTEECEMAEYNGQYLPIHIFENLCAVSTGYLYDYDDSICLTNQEKNDMIKKLLKNTCYEGIDVLVIDTPPGTSDEHITLVSAIREFTGAVIISMPQVVSLLDVRRQLSFCRKTNINIFGLVENMCQIRCDNCASTFGEHYSENDLGIEILGRVHMEKDIAFASDTGKPALSVFSSASSSIYMLTEEPKTREN